MDTLGNTAEQNLSDKAKLNIMHMRQGTMKIKQDMTNKHAEAQAKMFERDTGTGDKQMTDYHRKH